jgi:hypothetical protein
MWLNAQPVNRCQQRVKKCLIFIMHISFAAALAVNCGTQERDPSQMSREEWQGARRDFPATNRTYEATTSKLRPEGAEPGRNC